MNENKPARIKRRKFTVIHWTSPEKRPEEGSFILLQMVDPYGVYVEYGSYEKGRFRYYYSNGKELLFGEESVLGWAYPPFWLFKEPYEVPPVRF